MRNVFSSFTSFAKGRTTMRRVAAIGMIAVMPTLTTVESAQASTPAETYVSENIDKGLQILSNKQVTPAQRAAQFQTFLESLTDVGRIGRFTLGAARRTASPGDIAAFEGAFKNYAAAVYQSRLAQYSGQSLKVTGSTERQSGDFVVVTQLIDPTNKSSQQPLEVDFRVLNDKGRFVVIDVSIAGVWLAIEERDQFSAFLSQHGGSIPALVTHLNQLTAQLKNGGGGGSGRSGDGH